MAVQRIFLGWDRPLCETAPEWLLRGGGADFIDLRGMAVVTPTRQSSWRLRKALPLTACELYGAALLAPEIVTPPALLEPPPSARRRASDLQVLSAWCTVLRSVPSGEMDAFLGKQRPGTFVWALRIARRLVGLRRELADGLMSIAGVAASGKATEEAERWQSMAELERRYLAQLESWRLRDKINDQLAMAEGGQLDPAVKHVVLAAVPDPPRLLIALLEAWRSRGGEVTVLVAAPEEEAEAFDAWGRPLPDRWAERAIDLDERDIILAADPEAQAARLGELLREIPASAAFSEKNGRLPALAIGVPDREIVAPLQRELAALNLSAFDPRNRAFGDTPLFRLVQSLLDWRESSGYEETAVLLRHPDVLAALKDAEQVLRELDELQGLRLPVTFEDLYSAAQKSLDSDQVSNEGSRSSRPAKTFHALHAALTWLARIRRELCARSLTEGLRSALKDVYHQRRLHPGCPADNAFRQCAEIIDTALRELEEADAAGQTGEDSAVPLLRARLQGMKIKPERAGEPIDLEGWLELAWNPAPILCIAGMNEGFVPDSHAADLFLPDTLRQALEMRHDLLRVSRDVYILSALRAQRAGNGINQESRLVILVGKRSAAGDPLRPSRLFFRCPDNMLARRAQALFRDPPPMHAAAAHSFSFKLDPRLVPPRTVKSILPARISPTALKDYLTCPFRFYLRRVLDMEAADDRAREPDAAGFGNLCHAVVQDMGRDTGKIWACGDAVRLADWLQQRLLSRAVELYGEKPWPGVTLAVESAARRLQAFAGRQTAWHAEGWDIAETEVAAYVTEMEGVKIHGKIDRIDRNRNDGAVCVLDYKTTDKVVTPQETHLTPAGDAGFLPEAVLSAETMRSLGFSGVKKAFAKRWADLQLPLYREMVRARHGADVAVGYILLPAAAGETGFALWHGYHDALHGCALACAGRVLSLIRRGVFWPPAPRSPLYDDFRDLILDEPLKTFKEPPLPWPAREAGVME